MSRPFSLGRSDFGMTPARDRSTRIPNVGYTPDTEGAHPLLTPFIDCLPSRSSCSKYRFTTRVTTLVIYSLVVPSRPYHQPFKLTIREDMTDQDGFQLRWGVIGKFSVHFSGTSLQFSNYTHYFLGYRLISSWFVADLMRELEGRSAIHVVKAIGSSSKEKARTFTKTYTPSASPELYTSYQGVYDNTEVDIVYIGTPHTEHYQNAMDAINSGKNVLCEKPLTINTRQTESLIKAARKKNVYLMEGIYSLIGSSKSGEYSYSRSTGVWTRFFPVAAALKDILHEQQAISSISRVFINFRTNTPIESLPKDSRMADPARRAGVLLDTGIYTLTWASIIRDEHPGNTRKDLPIISSAMNITGGVNEITSVILTYPELKSQAICTASILRKGDSVFRRIEGSRGTVLLGGSTPSKPLYIIIREDGKDERKLDFFIPPMSGFYYEQDAIAADLRAGRKESSILPLDGSLRIIRIMDEVHAAHGLKYAQDNR
jgi:predicted dehydrogenase